MDVKRVVVNDAWAKTRGPAAGLMHESCFDASENVAQIRALVKRSDLNFRLGKITGEGTTNERKRVKVEGIPKPLSIRERNLVPLQKMKWSRSALDDFHACCQGGHKLEYFRNVLAFQENLGLGSPVKDLLNKHFKIPEISQCIIMFSAFTWNSLIVRFGLTYTLALENMGAFTTILNLPCIDVNLSLNIGRFDAPPFEHAICKDLYDFASILLEDERLDVNFHPFCHCIGTDVDEPSPDASRLYSWRHFFYNCPNDIFAKFVQHPSLHLDTAWFAYKSLSVKLDMIEVKMFRTFGVDDVETGVISEDNVERLRSRIEEFMKFMRPIFKSSAKLEKMKQTSKSVEVRTLTVVSLDEFEAERDEGRDRIQEMMQTGMAQMFMSPFMWQGMSSEI